jgi:hypothetical protein
MNFTPNLVVGVVTTFLGAALLLDRLNLMAASAWLPYWPLALVLFGLSLVVQAFRPGGGDAAGPRQRPIISPGFVILLVAIWLFASNSPQIRADRTANPAEGTMSLVGVMSLDSRVSEPQAFHGATMTSVMGGSRLDLRKAIVAPGTVVTIDVFGLMGGIRVDVPQDWDVDIQTTVIMGGVNDRGTEIVAPRRRGRNVNRADDAPLVPAPAPPVESVAGSLASATPPRLVIRGTVMMGGLVIRS